MNHAQIKHMVDRFLGWKLPVAFNPDGGVSFARELNGEPRRDQDWPIGTNLLDAIQAEAMVRHMAEGLPAERGDEELTAQLMHGLTEDASATAVLESEPLLQLFQFAHLPPPLKAISRPFAELAIKIAQESPRNPERTVALRKLREAKDCAITARLWK